MNMNAQTLSQILTEIARLVRCGDSMGGSLQYEATDTPGIYEMTGAYRHGNLDGQGGTRIFQASASPGVPPKTPEEHLKQMHAETQAIYDSLFDIMSTRIDAMSADTAGALGFATGCLSKFKGLLGRDIDDLARAKDRPVDNGRVVTKNIWIGEGQEPFEEGYLREPPERADATALANAVASEPPAGGYTREEHLGWALARAIEYLDEGLWHAAVTSMISNLAKHPDWRRDPRLGELAKDGLLASVEGREAVRAWLGRFA